MTSVLSPVVTRSGFKPGLNALSATDVSGLGGGTWAAASLLYHAAYNAGLPILQRSQPSYLAANAVILGYEAEVAARPAGPDLVVANDTRHTLLLLLKSDSASRTTTAYIFNSSAVGRKVQLSPISVTLNQDGSIDVTLSRQISGDVPVNQDQAVSHYPSLDPYP